MDMKCIHSRRLPFIATLLVLEIAAGFSALSAQVSGTNVQQPPEAVASQSPATMVAQAIVSHEDRKTIVRVVTSGAAVYRSFHLTDPERVILDFWRARLAIPANVPSTYLPVRGIRSGQFAPDVARVVIDLDKAAPFHIHLEGNAVTVEFDGAISASQPSPETPPPSSTLAFGASRASGTAAGNRTVIGTEKRLRMAQPAARTAPPVSPPPTESEPLPLEPSFTNGMMIYRVQNQTLRSAVMRIGIQSGVAITMGEDLGTEPLSVEFRHFRTDEALRQLLKGYDTFFFYAGDDGNQEAPTLKAVWVYPLGHGQDFLSLARDGQ